MSNRDPISLQGHLDRVDCEGVVLFVGRAVLQWLSPPFDVTDPTAQRIGSLEWNAAQIALARAAGTLEGADQVKVYERATSRLASQPTAWQQFQRAQREALAGRTLAPPAMSMEDDDERTAVMLSAFDVDGIELLIPVLLFSPELSEEDEPLKSLVAPYLRGEELGYWEVLWEEPEEIDPLTAALAEELLGDD